MEIAVYLEVDDKVFFFLNISYFLKYEKLVEMATKLILEENIAPLENGVKLHRIALRESSIVCI